MSSRSRPSRLSMSRDCMSSSSRCLAIAASICSRSALRALISRSIAKAISATSAAVFCWSVCCCANLVST